MNSLRIEADTRWVSVERWEQDMEAVVAAERREAAANLAPYKIFKDGDNYVVKNNAGMVKAKFKSRAQALKYLRALYANVPGAAKKADKKKWTGKDPKPKKEAADVTQDNDAYRQGVADRLANRPMLTADGFAKTHPHADADDYPFYQAGYKSDRSDLKLKLAPSS